MDRPNGEELDGVTRLTWFLDAGDGLAVAGMDVIDVPITVRMTAVDE